MLRQKEQSSRELTAAAMAEVGFDELSIDEKSQNVVGTKIRR